MTEEQTPTPAPSSENNYEWVDDAFRLEKSRGGLWKSIDKSTDSTLIYGLTEAITTRATRFYLKWIQDGKPETDSRVVNDGRVGGKL